MYRSRTAYPKLTFAYNASDYLTFCYETLNAMYTKIPLPTPIGDASHDLGLMGESSYPLILDALSKENRTAQYNQLYEFVKTKYGRFASEAYPFASEASIDTTGFETSYTLAKLFGDNSLMNKVQKASLAARGLQPAWYWYGGDNRNMGESWWNLGYETQLGAWQQQEFLLDYGNSPAPDRTDMLRSTYGAYLAGWANINSGQINGDSSTFGASSWLYQSELGSIEYDWIPNLNGWWGWSGESDLGFWGGIKTASVGVVNDPVVGSFAYNGDLTETSTAYTISPKDGVRSRLIFWNLANVEIRIYNAQFTSATVEKNLSSVQLTLQPVSAAAADFHLTVRRLPKGSYKVSIGGRVVAQMTRDGATASVQLAAVTTGNTQLSITKG